MRQFLAVFAMFTGSMYVVLMTASMNLPIIPRDVEITILLACAWLMGIAMKS